MDHPDMSRRRLLKGGGAALAGLSVLRVAGPAHAFPGQASDQNGGPSDDVQHDLGPTLGHPGDEVIPWLDQPPPQPFPAEFGGNQLKWETLESWLIPAADFHHVNHFGIPDGLDESMWHVDIAGLVARL
jgi:DMSO/TMAO reductase YedYZ molybdopterin-dependent catalytic subunit